MKEKNEHKSECFQEGTEEHEFHEFENGPFRVVYLETYIEKEGGMYIQGIYATPAYIEELEKSVDNGSA